MDTCPYKNALGVPGEGIHSYRFLNIAIMDVFMTFVVAFLLSYALKIHFGIVAACLFLLGILLHRMFCVRTTIDKLLFS